MRILPPNPIPVAPIPVAPILAAALLAALLLVVSDRPVAAQTRQLTDDQLQAIDYHYKMDQYFVGGCLTGATFGAVTGLMTLSGVSVIAAVPYISTGCSVGFLIGGAVMVVGDFVATHSPFRGDGDPPPAPPAR
jgi:hypothetical protein